MRTFSITTLGCRVNHYEAGQIAALLKSHGLTQAGARPADLRIVHTCSVTVQAATKSRQAARRMVRLPVVQSAGVSCGDSCGQSAEAHDGQEAPSVCGTLEDSSWDRSSVQPEDAKGDTPSTRRPRVVVTGCWATSDPDQARDLPGVDAVLGHHQDVREELTRLLTQWRVADEAATHTSLENGTPKNERSGWPESGDEKWMIEEKAGTPAPNFVSHTSKARLLNGVNEKLEDDEKASAEATRSRKTSRSRGHVGMVRLPMLGERQAAHQRAFLKVQDGCDAHCTYCIIPSLRPGVWSKPVAEAVAEAQSLVDAGHREIVLTGIFLGAYGQETALRRRQDGEGGAGAALGRLVKALCTEVNGLARLRLSSLEPGDLGVELLDVLRSQRKVVPHFHLPLQSGSDALLRRMNRQYTRRDFLEMVRRVRGAFDRPAITTDIIVGFPGETDDEFARTVEVVEESGFVHVHAFSYSPRPGTAAARWTKDWVRGPVVNQRIELLKEMAARQSADFRRGFIGQEVEVLVENASGDEGDGAELEGYQHGRCERYFAVHFAPPGGRPMEVGSAVRLKVERVVGDLTFGQLVGVGQ